MNPIVIAGGGLAGAALAAALARAGRGVTLFEREATPTDKICGEFLSTEAQAYLTKLGLDPAALPSHPITHVRLVRGHHTVTTALPFRGLGISRKLLDEALLTHAAACGAEILRGHAVRHVDPADLSMEVHGIGAINPKTLFLATGKYDLRGAARNPGAKKPKTAGFKMYYRLDPAQQGELAHHVELIMFAGGYAGLQLVEDGQANLCFLADRALLARAGRFDTLVTRLAAENPHLARRLAGATPLLSVPLTIANVPYGYVHHAALDAPPDLYRLGDQAGVIQSFTGDGMSIALHSAALAAQSFLSGESAPVFQRRLAAGITGQIRRAGAIHGFLKMPYARPALFGMARAWPRGLALAAQLTRVPAAVRL
jgi:flavin-dependent dehydrogenase